MELYQKISNSENRKPVSRSIVDILTSSTPSLIDLEEESPFLWKKSKIQPFAINYAIMQKGFSPVIRGFEIENELYEIDNEKKIISVQSSRGDLFSEYQKIEVSDSYIYQGTSEQFVQEFINAGYNPLYKKLRRLSRVNRKFSNRFSLKR